jgi:hypothetical protein
MLSPFFIPLPIPRCFAHIKANNNFYSDPYILQCQYKLSVIKAKIKITFISINFQIVLTPLNPLFQKEGGTFFKIKKKKGPSPFSHGDLAYLFSLILKPFPSKTPFSSPSFIFFGFDIFYPFNH